jgi:ArsR family transcriptional regulator
MADDLAHLATLFAALGHDARLSVVRELLRAHPAGLLVGELQGRLGVPPSTLSHHLDTLRRVGIVETTREGTSLRQRISVSALREVHGFLDRECCAEEPLVAIRKGSCGAGSIDAGDEGPV